MLVMQLSQRVRRVCVQFCGRAAAMLEKPCVSLREGSAFLHHVRA